MKKCQKKRNFRELDEALDVKLKPFLYNEVRADCEPLVLLCIHNSFLINTGDPDVVHPPPTACSDHVGVTNVNETAVT
jgi:hypothetical protein